ncbi:MAG: M50 family metallopeptidase [Holosporales bacterium]|nr:M50 family metallopeptidase [Holosporales bacterium]
MSWLSDAFFYVIPFLLIFTLVVFVHELGHFWAARKNGIAVKTFAIGFGKEIFGRTDAQGTRWRVNLMPLGGYVLMQGMDEDKEGEEKGEEEAEALACSPFEKTPRQRFLVSVAGPLGNYLFAILLLSTLYMIVGCPTSSLRVGRALEESPAAAAGMLPGDVITHIDHAPVTTFQELRNALNASKRGETITVGCERKGETLEKHLVPTYTEKNNLFGRPVPVFSLGVLLEEGEVRSLPLPTALWRGLTDVGAMSWDMAAALGGIFSGAYPVGSLGGPVRIAEMAGDISKTGSLTSILLFIVTLSINLGLMNLFPLPGLDGGTALFCLFEGLLGRPISNRVREMVGYAGFMVISTLMLLLLGNDLLRLPILQKFWSFLGL